MEEDEEESLPAWGVWIEIDIIIHPLSAKVSLPAWGVWIEMMLQDHCFCAEIVAPRMGSVD